MCGNVGGALAQAWCLVDVLQAVKLALQAGEGIERSGVGVATLFQEVGAVFEWHAAKACVRAGAVRHIECGDGTGWVIRQRGKEQARSFAQSCSGALDGCGGGAFGAQHYLHIAGQLVEALRTEVDAKVAAGDVFQFVRLVEDDGACSGQHSCIERCSGLQLDRHVGEEEVVIDNDNLRLQRLAAHGGDKAVLPVGAGLAEAGLTARV